MSIAPPFSETVVLSVGKVTLALARDHQEALDRGGLSARRIDQMEEDIRELEEYPTTAADEDKLEGLTDAKNEVLEACYQWGGALKQRISDLFGAGSPEAERFPSERFSKAARSEDQMLMVVPTLLSLIDQLAPDLEADDDLDTARAEGEAFLEALRNKDLAQELFKVTKGFKTRHRQILRRQIYDTVNDITRTGRRVYRNDPEKRALFRSPWPRNRSTAVSPEREVPAEQDE